MGQTHRKERSFLGFVAGLVFTLSVMLALAAFGYGFYLDSSIANMAVALERGRAELEPETVNELIRLDDRINSTGDLISTHTLLSPLFKFLEASTVKSVRFTDFNYALTAKGLELSMRGEAKSYSALALQADIFEKSGHLNELSFSDLSLDTKGNVIFSFKAKVASTLLSYQRAVAQIVLPPAAVATSTPSTGSGQAATSSSSTTQ